MMCEERLKFMFTNNLRFSFMKMINYQFMEIFSLVTFHNPAFKTPVDVCIRSGRVWVIEWCIEKKARGRLLRQDYNFSCKPVVESNRPKSFLTLRKTSLQAVKSIFIVLGSLINFRPPCRHLNIFRTAETAHKLKINSNRNLLKKC